MKYQYKIELTITKYDDKNPHTHYIDSPIYECIVGDSLLQVLTNFSLAVARYAELNKVNSYICSKCGEDDIPF